MRSKPRQRVLIPRPNTLPFSPTFTSDSRKLSRRSLPRTRQAPWSPPEGFVERRDGYFTRDRATPGRRVRDSAEAQPEGVVVAGGSERECRGGILSDEEVPGAQET